jgi:hypothetical protein
MRTTHHGVTRRRRAAMAAVAVVVGMASLGTVTATALEHDTRQANPRPHSLATCSIFDVPTLESAVVARARPVDGVPYVLVCQDDFASCVEAETRSRAMLSSSDDGLPNPWEAGNVAAKCYLSTDT